jgi:uncharacterized protein YeaO (DUF488 family)
MNEVKIKRIYEPIESNDGFRILVDRLWPRAMNKEKAGVDLWMKEVSPSTTLRIWFGHDPGKWKEFKKACITELKGSKATNELIQHIQKYATVTLLYAAKDEMHHHALVLQEYLKKRLT